jgi:hypothetical protein
VAYLPYILIFGALSGAVGVYGKDRIGGFLFAVNGCALHKAERVVILDWKARWEAFRKKAFTKPLKIREPVA